MRKWRERTVAVPTTRDDLVFDCDKCHREWALLWDEQNTNLQYSVGPAYSPPGWMRVPGDHKAAICQDRHEENDGYHDDRSPCPLDKYYCGDCWARAVEVLKP